MLPPPGSGKPIVDVRNLTKHFTRGGGLFAAKSVVRAVDEVSFTIEEGETFGLVGESGSGKSTTGRCMLRLIEPTSGEVRFRGDNVLAFDRGRLRAARRDMQMVFQDPYSSLNPRMRARDIVEEPLIIHRIGSRAERRENVAELFRLVGLDPAHLLRYPHEFSGGQRQRIGLARALALHPSFVIADEPVSALDVSIQAQVINLLERLQDEFGLSYLLVAHDLSVVRHASDSIAVMYLGKLMEVSPARELFRKPIHPYTLSLYSAVPVPDPVEGRARERLVLRGDPPSPVAPPPGCRFHTRCPWATEICREVEPPLADYGNGHLAACHHPQNVSPDEISATTRSAASPLTAGEELPTPDG
jgi:oligopeptide/dipeptide ABC transporter ATP-binding protein